MRPGSSLFGRQVGPARAIAAGVRSTGQASPTPWTARSDERGAWPPSKSPQFVREQVCTVDRRLPRRWRKPGKRLVCPAVAESRVRASVPPQPSTVVDGESCEIGDTRVSCLSGGQPCLRVRAGVRGDPSAWLRCPVAAAWGGRQPTAIVAASMAERSRRVDRQRRLLRHARPCSRRCGRGHGLVRFRSASVLPREFADAACRAGDSYGQHFVIGRARAIYRTQSWSRSTPS
jgi:hypothetical protein